MQDPGLEPSTAAATPGPTTAAASDAPGAPTITIAPKMNAGAAGETLALASAMRASADANDAGGPDAPADTGLVEVVAMEEVASVEGPVAMEVAAEEEAVPIADVSAEEEAVPTAEVAAKEETVATTEVAVEEGAVPTAEVRAEETAIPTEEVAAVEDAAPMTEVAAVEEAVPTAEMAVVEETIPTAEMAAMEEAVPMAQVSSEEKAVPTTGAAAEEKAGPITEVEADSETASLLATVRAEGAEPAAGDNEAMIAAAGPPVDAGKAAAEVNGELVSDFATRFLSAVTAGMEAVRDTAPGQTGESTSATNDGNVIPTTATTAAAAAAPSTATARSTAGAPKRELDDFGRTVPQGGRKRSPPVPRRQSGAGKPLPAATEASEPPPDSRIFIGNLATERLSRPQLLQLFGKYGRFLEVSMHTSFGFVQYDNPDSALAAIAGETKKLLAGLTLGKEVLEPRST